MYVCLKRLDNNRTILWAADCVLLCSHSATYWEWHVSLHGSYTVQFDLCNEGHSAAAEGIVNNKSRPLRDAFNMANYFGGICHLRTIKRIRIRSWHPFWGAKCVNVYSRRRSSIHSNYKGHAQLSLLGQQHCFNSVKGQGLFEIRRTAAASWENFFYSSLEMQFKKNVLNQIHSRSKTPLRELAASCSRTDYVHDWLLLDIWHDSALFLKMLVCKMCLFEGRACFSANTTAWNQLKSMNYMTHTKKFEGHQTQHRFKGPWVLLTFSAA